MNPTEAPYVDLWQKTLMTTGPTVSNLMESEQLPSPIPADTMSLYQADGTSGNGNDGLLLHRSRNPHSEGNTVMKSPFSMLQISLMIYLTSTPLSTRHGTPPCG